MSVEKTEDELFTNLDQLVETTRDEFQSKEWFQGQKIVEPYSIAGAVEEVVNKMEDPANVYIQIKDQMTVPPSEAIIDDLINRIGTSDKRTWDGPMRALLTVMLVTELSTRHSELEAEENRRFKKYSG